MSDHPYRTAATKALERVGRIDPRSSWDPSRLEESLETLALLREGAWNDLFDQAWLYKLTKALEHERDQVRKYNDTRRAACALLLTLSLGASASALAYDKSLWPLAVAMFVVAAIIGAFGVRHERNNALLDSINDTINELRAKRKTAHERVEAIERRADQREVSAEDLPAVRVDTQVAAPQDQDTEDARDDHPKQNRRS